MRNLSGHRIFRPLLLLVGSALGATFLAPVAAHITGSGEGSVTAATSTRSVSCAGLNWYPTDSETGYTNLGPLRRRVGSSGSGVLRCDPGLPNKAIVTKVEFTVRDNEFLYEIRGCALVRSGLTPGTADAYQVLASVPATGVGALPGVVRLADSSAQFAAIENTKYGYWLECEISGHQTYSEPSFGIYGADVVYTISSANG